MDDHTRTHLDNLALTEAAFVRMTAPEFWATVAQDHAAAEDAIDGAIGPICDGKGCRECGLGNLRLMCGLNDSPISRMEYAIDTCRASALSVGHRPQTSGDAVISEYWRDNFVHECRRMIEAVRTIRKGIEQETATEETT